MLSKEIVKQLFDHKVNSIAAYTVCDRAHEESKLGQSLYLFIKTHIPF